MRSEAPKTVAFENLHALQTSHSSMPNKYAWILFRLLYHGKVPLASGYEARAIFVLVRIPVINWWKTLISHCGEIWTNRRCQTLRYVNSAYSSEKMHINDTCTWSVISSANNGPTASKVSHVTFTTWIQQPHYATWWLSHSLALFHELVNSGVMVVSVIFQLILMCMHLSPLIKCCMESNTDVLFVVRYWCTKH